MENEEISLREIIETLWEGKWIIVTVTAIVVALAAAYTFLIATPKYEAKATVIINKTDLPTGSLEEYVTNATTLDVVQEVMKSPAVMQRTIDELGLDERTVGSLQESLNITTPQQSEEKTLIKLTMEGTDREQVSQVLNTIVAQTKAVIREDLQNYITSYEELYADKMQEEQESLKQYLEEYNALENSSGLPLLILFQQNSDDSQYVLEANQELLQQLRDLEKIDQVEYDQINSKIEQANKNYQEFHEKYEDAQTAQTLNVVDSRIDLLSQAYAGMNPVSPNKLLNLAIGLVLGGMIAVFIVFIRAYWRNTAEESSNKSQAM